MLDFSSCLEPVGRDRASLIRGLQAVQAEHGFISDDAIRSVSEHFSIPLVEVEGVVSFYAQFKRRCPGKYKISVCDGTACHIKGSALILDWVSTELGIRDGETDPEALFSLETVACLGCCSLAPVMSINGKVFGKLDRKATIKILKEHRKNG